MESVPKLKDARSMVSEWAKPFVCPLACDTRALTICLKDHIAQIPKQSGVVLSSTFCNACSEAGMVSYVSSVGQKEEIAYANVHDSDFECPECKALIVPTPLPPTVDDLCDLDTVGVLCKRTFAEVHVLQQQLEADRIKIQDLEKALKMKEEHIQKLVEDAAGACAKTFVHCLKRPKVDGELDHLLKLSSTQPDTFRSFVKHEVFPKK